ncbi:T/G mismatch-specific endonuclease [Vogesella indigofera]|uniref:Very short patch repair endonuclease n=1 Tax=Vogesella indigofera TaxID=45465 RepID=A0A495AVX9_VOGIN|nr:very short patch repair endonuclease [Vogesella indigofera]RKQ52886.1 T/G mismatch-specific endonuclease [Vogesella indigofera]
MDIVDQQTRSRMMSGIRAKDTKPEICIRRYLHSKGFRFRLHVSALPGCPDIVLPKYRLCIFVHGCFWHQHLGCRFATMPATRTEFWQEKFRVNKIRDEQAKDALLKSGWRVLEIWECGLKNRSLPDLDWLSEFVRGTAVFEAWPLING